MQKLTTSDIVDLVNKVAEIIIKNEVYFCELDSVAGDGDFGMSVAKGFKQLQVEWDELSTDDIGAFMKDCSMVITEYCGGASGPIWGGAFRGAAKYAKGKVELTLLELGEMLGAAIEGIQKRGGAQRGDKTLLDALFPAKDALIESAKNELDIATGIKACAQGANEGAESTKKLVAKKGRATYVGERSLDNYDAGAKAIAVILDEIAKTM